MFTVIGDTILWCGEPVADFRRSPSPSVRETVEEALRDHRPWDGCDYCAEADERTANAEATRDAYAAILGV